jgi:hypothetical protein
MYHWGGSDGRDARVVAMVQDTQGKRRKRPKVSRVTAHPADVLWQEALLIGGRVPRWLLSGWCETQPCPKIETSGLKVQTVANRMLGILYKQTNSGIAV